MVRGSRRIPSPSLLLIGREKEKKEKHEHVNYLTASVKATESSATKKMSSCKFMPHKVSHEKRAHKFRTSQLRCPAKDKSIKIPLAP